MSLTESPGRCEGVKNNRENMVSELSTEPSMGVGCAGSCTRYRARVYSQTATYLKRWMLRGIHTIGWYHVSTALVPSG
ncbi:hypothetical protein SAMN05518855_10375 [Paenibacillus sp. CF384]|nr:hypothetical protein SAMN05518855_10375 [Paenibacillus sp. CF384]